MNMRRFYTLSLEDSLFGDILLVRRWGRIGTHGRVRFDWFDNPGDAANELTRIASVKARRGYQEFGPQAEPEERLGASLARRDHQGRDHL